MELTGLYCYVVLTRRNVLIGAGVSLFGKAPQPAAKPNFAVPPHACDCHTHIFGPQFPLSSKRRYTPEPALPPEMAAMHRAIRMERVVIVTASVYGTDNSSTLFGMKARGRHARGIAVIDNQTSDHDLQAMDKAGIRGIRLNLSTAGVTDPAVARRQLNAAIERIKTFGWHIQMFTSLAVIQAIQPAVAAAAVPIVFDHFGGAQAAAGVGQPGFSDLLELLKSGHAYVKISGAYLASKLAPDYGDVTPLAQMLIAANPDRVLWGTDWPHPEATSDRSPTEVSPFRQIDDARLLNQLPVWAPDPKIRQKILVDNPAKLYGF